MARVLKEVIEERKSKANLEAGRANYGRSAKKLCSRPPGRCGWTHALMLGPETLLEASDGTSLVHSLCLESLVGRNLQNIPELATP